MKHLLSIYALFLVSGCEQAAQRALIEEIETTSTTLQRDTSEVDNYKVQCTFQYEDVAIEVYYSYHLDFDTREKSEDMYCKFYGQTRENISVTMGLCESEETNLKVFIENDIPILSDGASEFELDCE